MGARAATSARSASPASASGPWPIAASCPASPNPPGDSPAQPTAEGFGCFRGTARKGGPVLRGYRIGTEGETDRGNRVAAVVERGACHGCDPHGDVRVLHRVTL